jgi:exodeoxyribonuclease VII small subunit
MSETFKNSYGVLQAHAQTLRKQSEPNIDDLLKIVEESVAAYKVCHARIDAVEKTLEAALGNAQASTAELPASQAKGRGAETDVQRDDDIPF